MMLLKGIQDHLRIEDLDLAEPDSHHSFANTQAIACRKIRSKHSLNIAAQLCRQRFDKYQLGELNFDEEAI